MKSWVLVILTAMLSANSFAHVPVSSDPFKRQGCTAGLSNLDESWALLGSLMTPGQIDYICFDAQAGDVIDAFLTIPAKTAYDGPKDLTMALVGPGLPVPQQPVPDGLFDGNGAVFETPPAQDGSFSRRNELGTQYSPGVSMELPTAGRYALRIFSPSQWQGEYYLVTQGANPSSGNLSDTKLPIYGDITQDGVIDINDVVQALLIALKITPPDTSFALFSGDVAPPGHIIDGIYAGDGVIDLGDAVRILRKLLKLDQTPHWPDFDT